jgi:hypothetical protein
LGGRKGCRGGAQENRRDLCPTCSGRIGRQRHRSAFLAYDMLQN